MKIFFDTLGCDKNLSDSEHMLRLLYEDGFQFTDDEEDADIAVVNTCCFINDAKKESIDEILRLGKLKENGKLKLLVATGCLSERFRDSFLSLLPEVDCILGVTAWDRISEVIRDALRDGEKHEEFSDKNRLVAPEGRILTGGGYYAYLKIAEGCNKRCTYCVIPGVRGNYRSVPMESLLAEAKTLIDNGVRELILVAQETTLYGSDLYGKKMLPELLYKLSELEGLEWIRILYAYPEEITDELIEAIRDLPKVVHYLDMPVQHASDSVLKRMGRRTTRAELTAVIEKLRKEIPDITLRTTLISGFPGETEEDHEELLQFIRDVRFDRLGVFAYSREEGTPASSMDGQIPARIKEKRRNACMKLQQEIAFHKAETLTGQILTVMIEGYLPDEGVYAGRTYMDAPEVDGMIFIRSFRELMSGDFVRVYVDGTSGYDLTGEVLE
ncbi:MAG: 30S ribosomal protein S12 methylthiotransferase RimO [Lachnospiraceae bacterium]|nr:30S ribosomal protein S12 methylthiotransferase RimO [Lachnospiraceae bacterium]